VVLNLFRNQLPFCVFYTQLSDMADTASKILECTLALICFFKTRKKRKKCFSCVSGASCVIIIVLHLSAQFSVFFCLQPCTISMMCRFQNMHVCVYFLWAKPWVAAAFVYLEYAVFPPPLPLPTNLSLHDCNSRSQN
jgi:hypothetical protein